MNNRVNHPKHYNSHPSGIECIEVIRHYVCDVAMAIKYLWRCGLKVEEGLSNSEKEFEDVLKARWYCTDRAHQVNPHKYLYPKNGHAYTILETVKSKNNQTGEWEDHVLYTDGKSIYTRLVDDFYKKFITVYGEA